MTDPTTTGFTPEDQQSLLQSLNTAKVLMRSVADQAGFLSSTLDAIEGRQDPHPPLPEPTTVEEAAWAASSLCDDVAATVKLLDALTGLIA